MAWLSRAEFPEGYEHHCKRRVIDKSIFIGVLLLSCGSVFWQATLGNPPAAFTPKEVGVLDLRWAQVIEVHENRVNSGEGKTYPPGATDVESEIRRSGYETVPVGAESVIPELSMRCNMQLPDGGATASVPCVGLGESIYFASEGKVWEQRPVLETWYHWNFSEDVVVATYSSHGTNSVPAPPEVPPLAKNQFVGAQRSKVVLQVGSRGEEPHWVTLHDASLVESILSTGMVSVSDVGDTLNSIRESLTVRDGEMPTEGAGFSPSAGH